VPQQVRLTPPEFVNDFVACLQGAGTQARRKGRFVVIEDDEGGPPAERELELLFFIRSWALSHPGLAFELVENGAKKR
jgi:hypothetical protein